MLHYRALPYRTGAAETATFFRAPERQLSYRERGSSENLHVCPGYKVSTKRPGSYLFQVIWIVWFDGAQGPTAL